MQDGRIARYVASEVPVRRDQRWRGLELAIMADGAIWPRGETSRANVVRSLVGRVVRRTRAGVGRRSGVRVGWSSVIGAVDVFAGVGCDFAPNKNVHWL